LKSVNKIIQILYFSDRAQSPQCHPDTTAHNAQFADAGVSDPFRAIFFLQPREALIYVSDLPQIFTECQHFWITCKQLVEITV